MSNSGASPPPSRIKKRVVASPRSSHDIRSRLENSENCGSMGPYGIGLISPLTELLASSPSHMQSLTPDTNGRHTTPRTNSEVRSSTTSQQQQQQQYPRSTPKSRLRAPPELDIVSPTTTTFLNRPALGGFAQSSLPELPMRKDTNSCSVGPSNCSVDASTDRCALSPSSNGAGRSLALTPVADTSHQGLSLNLRRASNSVSNDASATPTLSAPRGYSKRAGGGNGGSSSREATGGGAPPPRHSLSSGQRGASLFRQDSSSLPLPLNHLGDDATSNSAGAASSLPPRHAIDLMAFARTGDAPVEYDTPRVGRTLSESRNATAQPGGVSPERGTSRSPTAAGRRDVDAYGLPSALRLSGRGTGNVSSAGGSSTTPSAPATAAATPNGRAAQTESILATSLQGGGGNGGGGGFTHSSSTNGPQGDKHTNATSGGASGVSHNVSGSYHVNTSSHHSASSRTRGHDSKGNSSGVRSSSSRAPRLASHLFRDEPASPDSAAPTSSLQSPGVAEGKRRGHHRGGSERARLRASSEGRASASTEGSVVAQSPAFSPPRPTAATFAKGELIGKGSFGAVYRGMQRNTNRIICMKEIRLPDAVDQLHNKQQQQSKAAAASAPSTSATPAPPAEPVSKEQAALMKQMENVKRELTLLKQLNHPNIVKFLNDEIVDGCLRIYMEYVSGGSVASALKTYGSFEEPQAAALCFQLLQGLAYLHSRGIVHRDLKGDNLLLETSSELKIADFGTAKNIIASATMTANIVGTAYFMAPEVLRPDGVAGISADIWSTGCCVIEMLTAKPPLSDIPNQYTVMMTIAGSPEVPLDKYIPPDNKWSSEVVDFIKQCLRKDPAARPTVHDLLRHPWIVKHCDTESLYTTTTPATLTSSLTPVLSAIERPPNSAPLLRERSSRATSPDMVVAMTPTFTARESGTTVPNQPHSRSSSSHARSRDVSGNGRATPRDKRSKKEKRMMASKRQSRDGNSDVSLGGGLSASSAFAKPNPIVVSKTHPGGEASKREDERQQSFSYEYPPPTTPPRSAADAGNQSGSFLPAIPGTSPTLGGGGGGGGAGLASQSGFSFVDGNGRASRSMRHVINVGSSRDTTRAYQYPNDDDFVSRESMRLGDPSAGPHDFCRDLADASVRYGSMAKIVPVSGEPEMTIERGVYSTIDCLTAPPTAEEMQTTSASRRSTSRRNNNANRPADAANL